MNLFTRVLFSLFITVGLTLTAQAQQFHRSFLPENDFMIQTNHPVRNAMTEDIFNQVLDQAEKVYTPIFASKGLKFVLKRDWKDPTVNAYATRQGNQAIIAMFGGLARHKAITPDGFMLVACHEIGHHLGGAPLGGWASNEGQSDYWGTLKCMRRIFADTRENLNIVNFIWNSGLNVRSDYAMEACKKAHRDAPNQILCTRSAAAGMSLALLFADLRKIPAPKYETPDPNVVSRTSHAHPQPQCRLDTYFQGALCPVSVNEETDARNPSLGTCTPARGLNYGMRPRCWYAQKDNELRFQ